MASYSALGKALSRPVSGVIVGGAMSRCPQGVPWWRVVGKDGRFPVEKRDPVLGHLQSDLLKGEGVEMLAEGQVAPSAFTDPDLL